MSKASDNGKATDAMVTPADAEPTKSPLAELIRAAYVEAKLQVKATPLDELNRVVVKLNVCLVILAGLPAKVGGTASA